MCRSSCSLGTVALVPGLTVYQSLEGSPIDGCSAVVVVVAATSRMSAVQQLRKAGFYPHKIEKAEKGSDDERAALDRPGVILWRDLWEKPHRWTAM
jgi:hypothetical protein